MKGNGKKQRLQSVLFRLTVLTFFCVNVVNLFHDNATYNNTT